MDPMVLIAATVFPEILKLVAGDGTGNLVGKIVNAVTEVTGTTKPEDAKSQLAASPEMNTALSVQLAQIAYDAHKADIDADLESQREADAAANDSTASARQTLLDLAKANAATAYTPSIISFLVIAGFVTLVGLLIAHMINPVAQSDQSGVATLQLINVVFGTVAAGFTQVLNFWLGSSLGSRRKDIALTSAAQIQQAQSFQSAAPPSMRQVGQSQKPSPTLINPGSSNRLLASAQDSMGRAAAVVTQMVAGGHTAELAEARKYAAAIAASAAAHGLDPAIVCGVGSRESAWGLTLRPKGPTGTGDWAPRNPAKWGSAMPTDGKGWGRGLMQIDYQQEFAKTGNWEDPMENIEFGCKELAANIAYFAHSPDPLRSGIAAYNCGRGNVNKALSDGVDIDHYTTGNDYSADVIKRSDWFKGKI